MDDYDNIFIKIFATTTTGETKLFKDSNDGDKEIKKSLYTLAKSKNTAKLLGSLEINESCMCNGRKITRVQ